MDSIDHLLPVGQSPPQPVAQQVCDPFARRTRNLSLISPTNAMARWIMASS